MKHPFWIRDDLAASAFDPVLRAVQGALEPAADADVTQFQLTTRGAMPRVYAEDDQRYSSFEQMMEDQTGIPAFGPID